MWSTLWVPHLWYLRTELCHQHTVKPQMTLINTCHSTQGSSLAASSVICFSWTTFSNFVLSQKVPKSWKLLVPDWPVGNLVPTLFQTSLKKSSIKVQLKFELKCVNLNPFGFIHWKNHTGHGYLRFGLMDSWTWFCSWGHLAWWWTMSMLMIWVASLASNSCKHTC